MSSTYSLREALSWAITRFGERPIVLAGATLAYELLLAVLWIATWHLANGADHGFTGGLANLLNSSENIGPDGATVLLIGSVVAIVVTSTMASGYVGTVLAVADRRSVTIASLFKPRSVGPVVLAGLLVSIATWVGTALCVAPGVLVSIFTIFTVIALVDRDLTAVGAIKASSAIAKRHFGTVALAWAVSLLLVLIGVLLFGLGLLVTGPITALFLVYTFRHLSGTSIA